MIYPKTQLEATGVVQQSANVIVVLPRASRLSNPIINIFLLFLISLYLLLLCKQYNKVVLTAP
jgi:hypothetical protein